MTFIDKGIQERSIEFIKDIQLDNFCIREERLVFICECGGSVDCIETLNYTLFTLNALCDSRFYSFVYAMESKLVSMWTDSFTYIIPTIIDELIISVGALDNIITNNFNIAFHPDMLFCNLLINLEVDSSDYPIALYDGRTKTTFGIKFPLLQYYEKGMMGLILQCKKCFKFISYDIEGNIQYFKNL